MTITDGNVGFHRESSSPVNKHSLSGTPNHGTMGFSNEAFILSDIGVKEPPSFLREGWMDPQGWKCIDNENDEHPDLPKDIEDSVAWFSKEASLVKDDTLIAEVDTISGICEKEENFPRTISSEPIIGRDSMKLPPSRISSTGPVTYRSTEDCKAAASCPKIGRCSTRATMERSSALVSRNAGALVSDGSSLLFDAVSSVIREAFLGCFRCFPCSEGQLTCLEEVDTEPKGAWFDCKRVQSKDNFCYSNPTINLAEEVTSEPKFNRRQKLPTDEQADDVTAVRTLAASIHETQSDESRTHSVNQTSHTETEGNDSGESHDVFLAKDNPKISFTLQLEEDYKQRAADLGRSEGRRHDSDSGSSAKSPEFMDSSNQNNSFSWRSFDWRETEEEFPVLHESNLELADFNISFGEEFESDDIHGDVWEDTELKEAFGIYNLNAFYSYGSNSPIVLSSTSCKPLNEKFDEVFPTKQAATNPNIENDFELASNNRVYNVKSPTKENEISLSQRKWISQEALYNIEISYVAVRKLQQCKFLRWSCHEKF
ncbi:hypothetical protein FHG87_001836 [Trinorchestia longiramus]|nr:hypothetical protein FHG87_001836 [Trinorchestia longiramus]